MRKDQVILHHVTKEEVFAFEVPNCALSVEFTGVVYVCLI